MKIMTQCQRQK